ncbi:MAG: DMT family transporter [Coprobacillus sp.]
MSIYLQLFLASFFWGTNIIVMKLLLNEVPFLFLATLRVFLSLLFIGIYMKYKKISFVSYNKKKMIVIGILAIYLNFYFTFLGMNQVKGIDNALINALAPTLTFLFSIVLLKKKPNRNEWIAIMLSVFAFLLSIHFQILSIKIGFWLLFAGMFLYMLGNVLIQKWKLESTLNLSFCELLYGFIPLLIHCLVVGQFDVRHLYQISLMNWFLFIVISGIGFAYIQVTYMKSIQVIGALKTSFFLSLNPLFTYLESLIFLNESFDFLHCLSFALIGIAIVLIKKRINSDSIK